jgi:hypothetical protein
MTVLAIFALPAMIFCWGFFPVAMALMGKADVVTALRAGLVPGLLGSVMAFYFWFNAASFGGGVFTQVYYLVGTILGAAAAAFLLVGFTGFTFKEPTCMPCTAWVVNFVGVILFILGAYAMYYFQTTIKSGAYYTPGLVAGFAVLLFGVCCLITGFSVLGKIKGAWGIMAIVAINFIIAMWLLMG